MPLAGTETIFLNTFKAQLAAAVPPIVIPPEAQSDFDKTWSAFAQALFIHLSANVLVTLPAGSVIVSTLGSATAQSGNNPAPVVGAIT